MPTSADTSASDARRARKGRGFAPLVAGAVAVVALVLSVGSSASTYAQLSTTTEHDLLTVAAGSILAQSAFGNAPTVTYSAILMEKVGNLTVTNGGTVDAQYSTTVRSTGTAALANGVQVTIWKSNVKAGCATPTSPVSGTWASFPTLTGSLAAGAAQFYCVKTTLPSSTGIPTNSSVTATFTTVLTRSSWTSSAASGVTQSFVVAPDTTKPSAPVLSTAQSAPSTVRLTWTPATDNVGVTEYLVYRGSEFVGSVPAGTLAFSDTKRTPGSTYSYTVQARDKAGNSASSNVSQIALPRLLTCTNETWEVQYEWTNVPNGDPDTLRYDLYLNGNLIPTNTSNPYYRAIQLSPAAIHAAAIDDVVFVEVKRVKRNGQVTTIGTATAVPTFDQWGSKTARCM